MLACCCFVVSQLLIVITLMYLVMAKSKVRSGTCSSATVPLPLPPGPWPWPVVGSLPELVLNKPAFRWIHRVMKDMGTDIACFRLGSVHVVPITCPKIAREVLKKQDKNFSSRPLTFASGTISSGHVARHYCGNVIRRLVFGQRYFGEPQPDGGPGPMEMEHMDASFALLGFTF
ncbi:tyrosine N-monooxygenase-like, partial [Triticum dicoccoides]|uniref:tyrosine N-monooxygenase-like n=1 Tax=Triticum dicoccoides TaxID=85692 RepID=UPI001891F1A2